MENLEISARTVEEATQQALEQLGVARNEVEVTVLSEGKTGILGLGAEDARVRVSPLVSVPAEESAMTETAKSVLETLLTAMGITASVVILEQLSAGGAEEEPVPVTFDIRGDDLGILIGRHGQTLSCLQHIVRLIVSQRTKAWVPIIIDVEGYKQRRSQALQAMAHRMAERVKIKGTPFALEPMPAYERRVIHITLAEHPDVSTESIGDGDSRKVVISLKEMNLD